MPLIRKRNTAVENHPKCKQIEQELLTRRKTYAQLSREFGLSVHSLNTHMVKRMRPAMAAQVELEKLDLGKSTRDNLDWMIGQAKDGITDAKIVSDFSGMAALLGQGIRAVELLSEVNGEIRKTSTKPELGQSSVPQKVMIQVISIPKGEIEQDSSDNPLVIDSSDIDIIPS